MFALYQRYHRDLHGGNSLDIDGYFTYGRMDNDADGTLGDSPTTASWNDDIYGFGLKGTWNIRLSNTDILKPFAGIEFLNGSQGSFGGTFRFRRRLVPGRFRTELEHSRRLHLAKTNRSWQRTNSYASSDCRVRGRRLPTERIRENGCVRQRVPGGWHLSRTPRPHRQRRLNWAISGAWSAGAFYHLECRENMTNQSVTATVRYSF